MTCLICKSEDKAVGFGGTFVERICTKCGRYGMQGELIKQMKDRSQKLHVDRTRAYLMMRLESGENPWITPIDISEYNLLDA